MPFNVQPNKNNLFHIYNGITNLTDEEVSDLAMSFIIGSYNNSFWRPLLDAGWSGMPVTSMGKYRISDPKTASNPNGQVNLAPGTPEDTTANYLHSNIASNGEVIQLRDETDGKYNNFLLYPAGHAQAGKVIRNAASAMGYPMSDSIRDLFDGYPDRFKAENPDVEWGGLQMDDQNLKHFLVWQVGVMATNRWADPAGTQYWNDTKDWALHVRTVTEENELHHIPNVQGIVGTEPRPTEFVDLIVAGATRDVVVINEFFGTQNEKVTSWQGYAIAKAYLDFSMDVMDEPRGMIANVISVDAKEAKNNPTGTIGRLFQGLYALHLLAMTDWDRTFIKPGYNYSEVHLPPIMAQCEAALGAPTSVAAPIATGSHTWAKYFEGGIVQLNLDNGEATFSFEDNPPPPDPEPEDDDVLDNTLEVITEANEDEIAANYVTEFALLDAFLGLQVNQQAILVGDPVVYSPTVYNNLYRLTEPRLLEALRVADYFAVSIPNNGISIKSNNI